MPFLYHDPVFLEHDTGRHPESAERLRVLGEKLRRSKLPKRCQVVEPTPIRREWLQAIHAGDYIKKVADLATSGGGNLDPDTVVSPRSYDVAAKAAGSVCDAVIRVIGAGDADAPDERRALCLVRPPGHHALPKKAMGFCLFSNIALGARLAVDHCHLDRVLVVDWDVHHGNGTQDIFWRDEQVGFFSAHRFPFWPGSGDEDETGAGKGLGATRNLPVKFGTARQDYRKRFVSELEDFAKKIKPQLVMISAGFDAHVRDPIGSLELETEDFGDLTDAVLSVANQYAGGRVVSVLEGGYRPADLADCVVLHLERLLTT